jgi:hypothetical protein
MESHPLLFQIHIFGDLLIYRTIFELCWVAQYILLSLYVYQSEITIGQPFVDKAASHKGIGSSLKFFNNLMDVIVFSYLFIVSIKLN